MLSGEVESDGCGGRLTLAAQNVTIDAEGRTLRADVVDRTYRARIEGERLVAEGRFGSRSCPDSTLFERWAITTTATGFEGTLETLWLFPPCTSPCLLRTRVVGVREGLADTL